MTHRRLTAIVFYVLVGHRLYYTFLQPEPWRLSMSLIVTVGHSVSCGLVYLDQNGNPMLSPVVPDSPPSWSHVPSASGVDTMTTSGDGNSATVAAQSPGTDTVSASVVVGGRTFSASLDIEVDPAPQVVTSVQIAASVD